MVEFKTLYESLEKGKRLESSEKIDEKLMFGGGNDAIYHSQNIHQL